MALLELKTNPSTRELKQFGAIVLPLVSAALGFWLAGRSETWTTAALAWGAGAGAFVVALLRPRLLRPVFVGWMLAAYPIGWVVSHLLLAAIYFLVIAPIGIVLRIVGRDPLERRIDREAKTYWVPQQPASDPARYFRQF